MKAMFSLAGWNWRLARRYYGILCAAFGVQRLAVLLYQASRPNLLGAGLAVYYGRGLQFPVFGLVFLLAGLLAGPAVNDWKRAKCSYTWLTLPLCPGLRLAAQVLTAALLELGVVALQLGLYLVFFFPVQAMESAMAMQTLGTSMPAQNLYEQLLLNDSLYWVLPHRPAQLALQVMTLLVSALLLSCVRLHRGWRRGVAVVIGAVCALCCAAALEDEKYTAWFGPESRSFPLWFYLVGAVLVVFSLWWALRAIRRAEPA